MTTATTPARCRKCGASKDAAPLLLVKVRGGVAEHECEDVAACLRRQRGEDRSPDAAEARWATLREEIKQERKAQDEIAAEHAEWGREGQSVFCYGRVKALDWVLATMDRMEADR